MDLPHASWSSFSHPPATDLFQLRRRSNLQFDGDTVLRQLRQSVTGLITHFRSLSEEKKLIDQYLFFVQFTVVKIWSY